MRRLIGQIEGRVNVGGPPPFDYVFSKKKKKSVSSACECPACVSHSKPPAYLAVT